MVSRRFYEFLQSGLISSVKQRWRLKTLRSESLVLSSDNSCVVVSKVAVMKDLNLSSDQQEADTESILHCANVLHGFIVNGSNFNK